MFKKIFLAVIFTLSVFLFVSPVHAEEKINNFQVDLQINEDASFHVQEKIDYDFGDASRHGIYRDIPYKYDIDGKNYEISINNIKVTDNNGQELTTVVNNQGRNKHIRVGDADVFVSGQKNYVINYDVVGAINPFEDHDEIFWNVTGHDWQVAINNVEATVTLPTSSPKMNSQITCYAGNYGSKNLCDSFDFTYLASSTEDISGGNFATKNLPSSFGMTLVLGFDKGVANVPYRLDLNNVSTGPIYEMPFWTSVLILVAMFIWLPILVAIIMFIVWFFKGRDKNLHDPIIAQYDSPDNLPPAVVGTILDERVDKRDISSEIIYLAIAGYFKIIRTETKQLIGKKVDYTLEKLKDVDDNLQEYQKILIKAFFGENGKSVDLSDLKYTLSKDFKDCNKSITKFTLDNGYFEKDPNKVRLKYLIIGFAFVIFGMVTFPAFVVFSITGFMLSGIIIILFGLIMSKRTIKGVKARNYILGLKEYIRVAEKERIKFHNAPEKNPQTFEKFLPYAMVFKLEERWAEQFKDIYLEQPNWYNGNLASFSAVSFINELNNFNSVASTAFKPQNSSSSGFGSSGFSGGGFGGGGGGSW